MRLWARKVLIGIAALVIGAVPALALAREPGRDAAADEYGTTTGTTPGPIPTTPGGIPTTPTNPTTPTTPTTPSETTPTVGITVGVTVGAGTTGPTETTPGATTTPTTPDEGEVEPDTAANPNAAGDNTTSTGTTAAAGVAPARAAGGGGNALGCGGRDQKYAYIALSPVRKDAMLAAMKVTGRPAYLSEIDEPLDAKEIAEVTKGTEWEGAESDPKKLQAFAEKVGMGIPDALPIAKKALALLSKLQPDEIKPIIGIVFTHRNIPLKGDEDSLRDAFVNGLIRGLRQVRVATTGPGVLVPFPIVGIEVVKTKPSTIAWFKHREVPTVDHVDTKRGLASLLAVLDGARGYYGLKKTERDGPVAQEPDNRVLLCRPDVTYRIGEFLRVANGGIPGGGVSIGILLLLGFAGTIGVLTLAERKTRRLRRHATDEV
jgi:hypothetical protein